jgi:hypothetical protein
MGGGPRVMKRGTSKAVPVVVSAGLAVGVFCGLLFGLGTGGDEASASPSTSETKPETPKTSEVPEPFQPKPAGDSGGTTVAKADGSAATPAGGSAATPAGGSAAPPAGGSAAGSAAPVIKMTKLIIEIKPDEAAKIAQITVDGKDTPATSDFELGDAPKKKVKVVIKAAGYRDVTHEGDVEGAETKFSLEMQKKPKPTGGGNLPRPETGGGKKPPPGGKKPGGLIDI